MALDTLLVIYSDFYNLPILLVFTPDDDYYHAASRADGCIVNLTEYPPDVEDFICLLSEPDNELLTRKVSGPISGSFVPINCGFAP